MKTVYAGVDLGGTSIKLGLVSEHELLSSIDIPADNHQGLRPALDRIAQALGDLLLQGDFSLGGFGFGFPGLVDCSTNRIIGSNAKYPDAGTVNLARWTQETWGVPLALDNDARLAAIGEWKFGGGKGLGNLVVLTLGTGIGSGVVLQNRVLRGVHYRAGNLGGHVPLGALGSFRGNEGQPVVRCNCGNLGCAEAYASTWALQRDLSLFPPKGYLSQYSPKTIGFKEVFLGVRERDPEAKVIAARAIEVWGALVVSFIHNFDPEAVILTGNVMGSADLILPGIQQYVDAYAWTPEHRVLVRAGVLGSKAAVWGAGYLASKTSEEVHHEFI